jgi:subtilase family serine protease
LSLSIGLPLRNEQALNYLFEQLYDPTSPFYHQFLTSQEFADRFGPNESDYLALTSLLETNGLMVVGRHPNRLLLDVTGTVADIERVFATRLHLYHHPRENRLFYAPEVEPSIEQGVSLLDISGLDNYVLPHPSALRSMVPSSLTTPNIGSAPGGGFRGNDFRAAYLPGVALSGAGQVLGLLEFDGYYNNDILTYETAARLSNVSLQNVLLNGFAGTPGANNAEVALDIEVAISLAPGLSSIVVYEGISANTVLNKMATENRAKQLSSSWTFGINSTTENIFRQYALQGQSMFQASGDSGAYVGGVDTPADDPNVTVVGGTELTTTGPAGTWVSESTWNWANTGAGANGSGGGISTSYPIPNYQKGIDMSSNQGSTTMRNIPDVAMAGDNVWVVWNNGSKGTFAGTSVAAPLWAAFMALVNQQAVANGKATMGFLNPALYSIGTGTNYTSCFHDIHSGNNENADSPSRFSAVPGYDLCTGWGTPAGQTLINALAGGTNLPPVFNKNPFFGPSAVVGQSYSGSISNEATDANPGDPLSFAKISGPDWLTLGPDGSVSGTPGAVDFGTNTFVVSVKESAGMSNTAMMYVNVDAPPSFTRNPLLAPSANAGHTYSASITDYATDPNPSRKLTFAKLTGPAWLTVSASGSLSGTPANVDAGTNTFTVSVSDSGGLSDDAVLYVFVNGVPFFTADPFNAPAVMVGQDYTGSLTELASDPDSGSVLTFSKVSGPAWLIVGSDGTLSGIPGPGDAGLNSFNVAVTDSGGLTGTATMMVPVTPNGGIELRIRLQSNLTILSWTGGDPPFQVQVSTNLVNGWQNFGNSTTNYSLSFPLVGTSAAYRIQANGP